MTSAIVVELPPTELPSLYTETLLDSCDTGMQQGAKCVTSSEGAPEPTKLAVAIVSWKGSDHREARIEVGLRAGTSVRWQARVVTFSAGDLEIERWRTLGFAVATLVKGAVDAAPDAGADRPASVLAPVTSDVVPLPRGTGATRDPWTGASVMAQFVVQSGAPGHLQALERSFASSTPSRASHGFSRGPSAARPSLSEWIVLAFCAPGFRWEAALFCLSSVTGSAQLRV